jgi:hypothetical protein
MDMIPPNDYVDGCVHFYTADFRSEQILLVIDVMYMVVLDYGEHTAQVTDDTCLAAIVYATAADDMGADVFLCPALVLRLANCIPFCLSAILETLSSPLIFVVGLKVFSQRNTAATGI